MSNTNNEHNEILDGTGVTSYCYFCGSLYDGDHCKCGMDQTIESIKEEEENSDVQSFCYYCCSLYYGSSCSCEKKGIELPEKFISKIPESTRKVIKTWMTLESWRENLTFEQAAKEFILNPA